MLATQRISDGDVEIFGIFRNNLKIFYRYLIRQNFFCNYKYDNRNSNTEVCLKIKVYPLLVKVVTWLQWKSGIERIFSVKVGLITSYFEDLFFIFSIEAI